MNVITTRTLHLHTAQEVFDFVCTKVIEQGRRSHQHGKCRYRSENGDKCAFGHVIADEDYWAVIDADVGIEIGSISHFDNDAFSDLGWTDRTHLVLLEALQMAHDTADGYVPFCGQEGFVTAFKRTAASIAADHGLNTSALGLPQ